MSIATAKAGDVIDGTVHRKMDRQVMGHEDGRSVAILGCGPAGLLAAHAVALTGNEPFIISASAAKSEIPGAVYLHKPIPEITDPEPDALIQFIKLGEREVYAHKVYGNRRAPCSWDKFDEGEYPAWMLQDAYDKLWERYSDRIAEQIIDAEAARMLVDTFPLVVSTIPAYALCEDDSHGFKSRTVWITKHPDSAVERYGDPVVIYDGRLGAGCEHYRTALIFGYGSTEYGSEQPDYDCVRGTKPMGTDCDCIPEILRVGRFGTWEPGVLVHQAFENTFTRMFEGLEGSDEMQ